MLFRSMMYQAKNAAHIGYPEWRPQGAYPTPKYVEIPEESRMFVRLEGDSKAYESGTVDLQSFTNINNETYAVNIMNGGETSFEYKITTSADWIRLTKNDGTVSNQDTVGVHVDFSKLTADDTGKIIISGNGQTLEVNVTASVMETEGLDEKTFIEAHNYISIEAAHYTESRPAANEIGRAHV